MAKVKTITCAFDSESGVLTFNILGAESFTVETRKLSDEMSEALKIHGLVQKISDGAAIAAAKLPKDAKKAANMKRDRMIAIRDNIMNGNWRKPSEGGATVSGLIFRAYAEYAANMAEAKGKTAPTDEKLREVYEKKTRAEKLALRKVPEIAEIMERLRSESGEAASVDTDALLGELGL